MDGNEDENSNRESKARLWVRQSSINVYSNTVSRIGDQAVQVHKKGGHRFETFFYKVVLGGNVEAVKKIINYMQEKGYNKEITWLLKPGHVPKGRKTLKTRCKKYCVQSVMFIILAILGIIITPLFYALHTLSTAFFSRQKKRISADIQLPLAYAAFSQNEEMIKYFVSQDVDIESTDGKGNNVFHYIGDLSSESSERAIEIFCNLVQFLSNTDAIRRLLIKRPNAAGLSAVEYTAKFGSPALLTQMLNHPNILQRTVFAAGDDILSLEDENSREHEDNESNINAASSKLEYVDITIYEAGSIANQSTLLNLLSDRDVATMTLPDLALFEKSAFVGKWIALKVKQMIAGVLALQLLDVMVTALLLFVLGAGHIGSPFEAKESQTRLYVMINEIVAMKDNRSHIFKEDSIARVLEDVRYGTQLAFLDQRVSKNETYKSLLFENAVKIFPKIDKYYSRGMDEMIFTRNQTPSWIADRLYDTTLTLDEFEKDWPLFYVWRYLPSVIHKYTNDLFKEHPHIFTDKIDITNREKIENEMEEFFKNFSIMVNKYKIQPSLSFTFWDFHNVFCVQKEYIKNDDLLNTEKVPPPEEIYHSSCDFIVIRDLANEECKDSTPQETYEKIKTLSDMKENNRMARIVDICYDVIVVMSCLYIFLDLLERFVFLYTCVSKQTKAWQMILAVLGNKVPGSYPRKQINLLTYFLFLTCFVILYSNDSMAKMLGMTHDEVHELGTYFLIIGLVFRFVMHIHAMRLLPGIGHFVITTFMMGTNLMHFSAVFGIVVFIFSILFHILIDDPNCVVEKYTGFRTMIESIFSTFKLTFGHGDFSPFFTSTPVKLTYTLYVIVVGLLLMNLIIAIMSTTATEIMTDPWKDTLWRVEWLDEATSVEYTFSVLGLLIRPCHSCGYDSHRRAGFIVQKEKGQYKVYIQVFHCPSLD